MNFVNKEISILIAVWLYEIGRIFSNTNIFPKVFPCVKIIHTNEWNFLDFVFRNRVPNLHIFLKYPQRVTYNPKGLFKIYWECRLKRVFRILFRNPHGPVLPWWIHTITHYLREGNQAPFKNSRNQEQMTFFWPNAGLFFKFCAI